VGKSPLPKEQGDASSCRATGSATLSLVLSPWNEAHLQELSRGPCRTLPYKPESEVQGITHVRAQHTVGAKESLAYL
jgi:hypothetical protein